MKYKTMKEYLGGGYMKPMLYQTGGYVPGLSSARYGLGLQRDVTQAQEEFEEQYRKLAREQRGRGLFSGAGKVLGTAVGAALTPFTGPAGLAIGKGLGSALGSGLGELAGSKLYDAGDMEASKTGLFREDFSKLKEMEEAGEEGVLGRAVGAGVGTALGSGLGTAMESLEAMQPGELFGNVMNKLKFGTTDLSGSVVDRAGSLVDIPEADIAGATSYFGYEEGGAIGPKFSSSFEEIPLQLRRSYGGDRRSESAKRMDALTDILDQERDSRQTERAMRYEGSGLLADIVPDEMPSMYDKTEMDFLASLPRAKELGESNELLAMAKESMAQETKMKDLARNLGINIASQMGKDIPQLSLRRIPELSLPPLNAIGMMKGGKLKEVPEGNKGLMNLPQEVRNRMGYMMEGGMIDDYMAGGMMDNYMYGGMAKKKKKSGYMGGGMTMGRGLIDMMPFNRRIL